MRLHTLFVLLFTACAPADAPRLDAGTALRADAVDDIEALLGPAGPRITRAAGWLGTESGWSVVRIPAFPAPGEDFHVLAVMDGATSVPQNATLRVSLNDWGTFHDVQATGAARGGSIQRWGPYRAPAGVAARFAIRLTDNGVDTWLNNNSTDYTLTVADPEPITFLGDHVAVSAGAVLPATGATVAPGDPVAVYASTYPQGPDTSVELLWAIGGVQQPRMPLRIEFIDSGPFGNDTRWEAFLDTTAIPAGATVTYGLRARSVGPATNLTDGGMPFQFTVDTPAP